MKHRDILYLALVGLTATNAGCKTMKTKIQAHESHLETILSDYSYDNSPLLLNDKQIEDMLNPVAKYHSRAIFESTITDDTGKVINQSRGVTQGWGSGIIFRHPITKQFYFLTCNHVSEPYKENKNVVTDNSGRKITIENKILKQSSYIQLDSGEAFSYNPINASDKYDLSILELRNTKQTSIPYFKGKFAEGKRVKRGDVAYVVGFPAQFDKMITQGIISNPTEDVNGIKFTMTTSPINPGNSGGPLYLLKKGKPVFAGISQGTYPSLQGMHQAAYIDNIREYLKNIHLKDLIK